MLLAVPGTSLISSTAALLSFVDVVYNNLYHPLGGSAKLGCSEPDGVRGPRLGNALRTLFLYSVPQHKSCDETPNWSTPCFRDETLKSELSGRELDEIVAVHTSVPTAHTRTDTTVLRTDTTVLRTHPQC